MLRVNKVWGFTVLLLLSACASMSNDSQKATQNVITASQVTYSLCSAILLGTDIDVINIPEDGRKFNSLKDYIQRRTETFEAVFADADAVVAMTNLLPADPLFRFARDANIHLVNIDAAQPWSYDVSGVTVVQTPISNVNWAISHTQEASLQDSPYFWLSLTNAVRMTDIIGTDLARVFPNQQQQIIANRNQLKQNLLDLSREFQDKFIGVEDVTVFALANEFVYLTNDLGLYVDGYFLKQDIDWTDQDLTNLSEHLQTAKVKVVIHKWQPSEAILAAINQAGATLVVLDTADPGISFERKLVVDGYQQILRSNLDKLFNAMTRK